MLKTVPVRINSSYSSAYEFKGIYKITGGNEELLSSYNNSVIEVPVGDTTTIMVKLQEKEYTHYITVNVEGLDSFAEYITECALYIKNDESGTSNTLISDLSNVSITKEISRPVTKGNVTWSVWLLANRGNSDESLNSWFKGLFIGNTQQDSVTTVPTSSTNAFSVVTAASDTSCRIVGYESVEPVITLKFGG